MNICRDCQGTGRCAYGCTDRFGRDHDCNICGGTGVDDTDDD